MRGSRDERGLVGRAAITLLISIVVLGVAGIDGGSILLAKLQLSDVADAAASAAADQYEVTRDARDARKAAVLTARQRDPGSRIGGFTVDGSGTITVTVKKTAPTLIVHRVGFLRHFGVVESTSTATTT